MIAKEKTIFISSYRFYFISKNKIEMKQENIVVQTFKKNFYSLKKKNT